LLSRYDQKMHRALPTGEKNGTGYTLGCRWLIGRAAYLALNDRARFNSAHKCLKHTTMISCCSRTRMNRDSTRRTECYSTRGTECYSTRRTECYSTRGTECYSTRG